MSDVVHLDLDDKDRPDRYLSCCGVVNSHLSALVGAAEHGVVVLLGGIKITTFPECTTCPACIEAYETAPQPVTTRDLLEVLRVARRLAHSGPPRAGGKNPSGAAAHKLEQRLKRPRRVKPVEESPK